MPLAALGLLVFRVTVPEPAGDVDAVLHNRTSLEDVTFASRLRNAHNVCVFAPSAVNLLTASTVDQLRRHVLARSTGVGRIAVLDPTATGAVALAARQLDDAVDYPLQTLPDAPATAVGVLGSMSSWRTAGRLECRFAPYNPGFSLVAVDPHTKHGC